MEWHSLLWLLCQLSPWKKTKHACIFSQDIRACGFEWQWGKSALVFHRSALQLVFTAAPACTELIMSAKIRDSINIIAHRIDPIPHMMCWTIQCIDLYIFKLSDWWGFTGVGRIWFIRCCCICLSIYCKSW
jgi:hypothetical protein